VIKPFPAENNAIMQIYLCTNMQYGKVRECFAEILALQEGIFSFSWKFNKMWRKCYSKHFQFFDKW